MSRVNRQVSRIWVLLAVVAGVALSTGFLMFGDALVSVDMLFTRCKTFLALFLIPVLLLTLSGVGLFLSRVIAINALVLVVLWSISEIVFSLLPSQGPVVFGEPVAYDGKSYYRADPKLGYALTAGVTARHRETEDGRPAYDVVYEIDEFGRRKTSDTAGRSRFILFFGGSNTFGEGVDQTSMLPYRVEALTGSYKAYNYGLHGYGLAQMLDIVSTRDLSREIGPCCGTALFYFIPAHMGRLVGASNVAANWGRHFSYYDFDANGKLVRYGSFNNARRLLTLFYGLIDASKVLRTFGLVLPRQYAGRDFALAAAVVEESRRRLRVWYPQLDLTVALSPVLGEKQQSISDRLARALRDRNIPVVDLTRALDLSDRKNRVAEHDYHQSGHANAILAQKLVESLGLR